MSQLRNTILLEGGNLSFGNIAPPVFKLKPKVINQLKIDWQEERPQMNLPRYLLGLEVKGIAPNLKLSQNKLAQYIFLTGWLKVLPEIRELEKLMMLVKSLRSRLYDKFALGDPDYIGLFLTYFPMFDGCFLLQTSDPPFIPSSDKTVVPQPKARVAPKLEAIPEEETTEAECESKQRSNVSLTPSDVIITELTDYTALRQEIEPDLSYFDF